MVYCEIHLIGDNTIAQLKDIADKYKVQIDITISSDSSWIEVMAWNNIGKAPYIKAATNFPASGIVSDRSIINGAKEIASAVNKERRRTDEFSI